MCRHLKVLRGRKPAPEDRQPSSDGIAYVTEIVRKGVEG